MARTVSLRAPGAKARSAGVPVRVDPTQVFQALAKDPVLSQLTVRGLQVFGLVCSESGEQSPGRLAEIIEANPSMVTRTALRLVEMGLVTRRHGDAKGEDKRRIIYEPTRQGRDAYARLFRILTSGSIREAA